MHTPLDPELPFRIEDGKLVRYDHRSGEWVEPKYINARNGRRCISWRVSGLPKSRSGRISSVARIIWQLHNGTIPDGMTVDHIDCNPSNDDISNLRLLSFSDNIKEYTKYKIANGIKAYPQNRKSSPRKKKPININLTAKELLEALLHTNTSPAKYIRWKLKKSKSETDECVKAIYKHRSSRRPLVTLDNVTIFYKPTKTNEAINYYTRLLGQ